MDKIIVNDQTKECILITGSERKRLIKLPFKYRGEEYCALNEENKIVVFKVPSKSDEKSLDAQVLIPEGIINKLEISNKEVTFSLNSEISIFGLPNCSAQATIGYTEKDLLYAVCSNELGNDLYFFTYNANNNESEWVKKEQEVRAIEMLDDLSYRVTYNGKQIIVHFITRNVSLYNRDIQTSTLCELEAEHIDVTHSFTFDERKNWTRIGEWAHYCYLLNNGGKTSIQQFSRSIDRNDKEYSTQTIFSGRIDKACYLSNIKRYGSLYEKTDEKVQLSAICGFYKDNLAFAYPIMLLDGSLVRADSEVNINCSLRKLPVDNHVYSLDYPGKKTSAIHLCEFYNKKDGQTIRAFETGKHDELLVVSKHLLLATNHNVLGDNGPEDRYYLYYFDNIYSKAVIKNAYKIYTLGDDGYIFYLKEQDEWIIKVYDKRGSMLYMKDGIKNIDGLSIDYKREFHLLGLQYEDNNPVLIPMIFNNNIFDLFDIKDYRTITTETGYVNNNPCSAILIEFELNDNKSKINYQKISKHPKTYIWFTSDGKAYICDFSRCHFVKHIEDDRFQIQVSPDGPNITINVSVNGCKYGDVREIVGPQMIMMPSKMAPIVEN